MPKHNLELCDIMIAALTRDPITPQQVIAIGEQFDRATAALLEELEAWRPLHLSSAIH
jgi:hypothetical protein